MPIDLQQDRQLIAAAQQNPAAFGFVFSFYYDAIFRYCVLRTGNAHDAEDLAMDVFADALVALPSYRWEERPILAWLFAIARHRGVSAARKRKVREASPEVESAASRNGLEEVCADVRRLLGKLDAATAEALVLRFVIDCSFEEIAALQGVALSAAKMRVYRAVVKARRALGVDDEG